MTHLINRNNVNRHRATKNHLSVNIRINENHNGKITDLQVQTCRNCPDEFCQDSRQYIVDLLNWKDRLTKTRKTGNTMAADVKALYPSLCRDTVTKVLECALEKHSKFNKAPEIIVQLNKICLNNVVTQYGDQLYAKKRNCNRWQPLCLTGKHCCTLHILQPITGVLREAELFRRFIDDIIWIARSESSNEGIQQALPSAFANSGLESKFRQTCTADQKGEFEFPDVNHCVTTDDDFGFVTKDFIKPTTEGRQFINGKSYHPKSTFKSILFGRSNKIEAS